MASDHSSSTTTRLTPEEMTSMEQELQRMLADVKPLIRPALFADIQERVWDQVEQLRTLLRAEEPSPPPLVRRPRTLPAPLNPFFFLPKS